MVNLVHNFWWIPIYPLVGAALAAVFRRAAGAIACLAVGLSFLHAIAVYLDFWKGTPEVVLYEWLPGIPFGFLSDALSTQMVLVVSGIGLLIHLYSLGYMAGEPGLWRYFACLNFFVFFMLLLVLANNLLLLFAGWEGVGLASYLLIGFHHDRPTVNRNANKAFLYNRAGDAGFLMGTLILLGIAGTLEFRALNQLTPTGWTLAAAILLALGATGKSAQLPLFVWLPDAMVGPTPVSALIHAATMVTAGIYLFARLDSFLALNPAAGMVIAVVGAATALLAATVALVEHDIKRILAYSTVSQLGLMFLAAGLGATGAAMFHVTTHAFFKALLFLTAGNVIHALHGEQDIRYMGGLKDKMPWTFRLMTLAGLSLAGFPGLAGFFSKDAILVAAAESPVLLGIALLVSFLTALYTSRMLWGIFYGAYDRQAHEVQGSLLHPLWPLGVGSIVAGFFGPHLDLHWPILISSGVIAIAGLWLGRRLWLPEFVNQFLVRKWFVNEAYEALLVRRAGKQGAAILGWTDRNVVDLMPRSAGWLASGLSEVSGWLDRFGVDGLVRVVAGTFVLLSYPVRLLQSGRVQHYALVVVIAAAASLGWYWLR